MQGQLSPCYFSRALSWSQPRPRLPRPLPLGEGFSPRPRPPSLPRVSLAAAGGTARVAVLSTRGKAYDTLALRHPCT